MGITESLSYKNNETRIEKKDRSKFLYAFEWIRKQALNFIVSFLNNSKHKLK